MTIGLNIVRLDAVDSTNNFAATMAKDGLIDHGTVIMAEEQTKGRGQRGNEWHSERGENLTFSLFLKPSELRITRQFQLTVWASVSMVEALMASGIQATIKWPNDILVNEQKIAGILIENSIEQQFINEVIVGVGLNVNQQRFNGFNGVSMSTLLGCKLNKEKVLSALLKSFHAKWKNFESEEGNTVLRSAYLSNLFGKDELRTFIIDGKKAKGIIRTVDENGLLCLELNGSLGFYDLKQVQFIFQNASSGLLT
jgi:BirA family biotin operon repressor/biotin-[acetyl-CoA-carboxylase] ligase